MTLTTPSFPWPPAARRRPPTVGRVHLASGLAAFALASAFPQTAQAQTPPDASLPPCLTVAGESFGACPKTDPAVTAEASGRFAAGGSLVVTTVPTDPVCYANYGGTWDPGTCYPSVLAPQVIGCAYIDRLDGNAFKEGPCGAALYRSTAGLPSQLWEYAPVNQTPPGTHPEAVVNSCAGSGNFSFYIFGGNNLIPEARWINHGPQFLECRVSFKGPRPDGLYGPTWVKMRAGITQANGTGSAVGKVSEFYVPIDGDERTSDVAVSGDATISELNWDEGRLFATYRARVTVASGTANHVKFRMALPSVMMIERVTRENCPDNVDPQPDTLFGTKKVGGSVQCAWDSLQGPFTASVEVVARILDATDLDAIQRGQDLQNFQDAVRVNEQTVKLRGVLLDVSADEDTDPDNNLVQLALDIPFRPYGYQDTAAAMAALAPYFNYREALAPGESAQCDAYANDIWTRLKRIRADHPEAFADLSFGRITSGTYRIPITGNEAGHVGIVVYRKGSHYRDSGIIVHGLPFPNPRMWAKSTVGDGSLFAAADTGPLYWTWVPPGWLFQTHADAFGAVTGSVPHKEGGGVDGFEGAYLDNAAEFTYDSSAVQEGARDPQTCPVTPDAVVVTTQSPVEISLTNAKGQRLQTENGRIAVLAFDQTIQAMATPHDDGSFGWTLLLPRDTYQITLTGSGTGAYTFTRTTFDADNQPVDEVVNGQTVPGQVDRFTLSAPPPSAFPPPGSGGGSLVAVDLLAGLGAALALTLGGRRRRRRAARPPTA